LDGLLSEVRKVSRETRSRSYANLILIGSTFVLDCPECFNAADAAWQGNLGRAKRDFLFQSISGRAAALTFQINSPVAASRK
jgi:hypothetical protein